ncbi:class I SAM-dependent methyltransferase [Billgrantia endophytica]|uniref:Ribosomal RNA small subunit methyltransferase J n=1 Tax=Billgrantia endophytica TaxID=2033802 RepID=A0A2N7U842_9GAMM|nr:class I SAM-dependent methyltransferase [Halomonas endophytica]PMR76602.1 rRNA methyltransferase [Halomonas endophytica]
MSAVSPVVVEGQAPAGLAARLGLPSGSAGDAELVLRHDEAALVLTGDPKRFGAPLSVDFVAGRAAHRRRFGGGRGQLIARACGLAAGVTPDVIDATAGLGRDAFVLAALGAEVLMIERVAAIYALLEDGLARARAHTDTAEIAARLSLVRGDAACQLEALVAAGGVAPQVIHLDPMFPHREKSALVKKEMRVFRLLAGDDDDSPRLLEAALDVATHRVVVKRPLKAPPIAGPAPRHVIEGKTSRYDLYVLRALKG